jgi:hypothetical protein
VTGLVPLPEMLFQIVSSGIASQGVARAYDRTSAAFGADFTVLQEAPVEDAATKKTVAKKTPGKPKAAAKTAKRAKPAPDDAVIVWRGRKNPFRQGTGAHERTERLREHDGQTVARSSQRAASAAPSARVGLADS